MESYYYYYHHHHQIWGKTKEVEDSRCCMPSIYPTYHDRLSLSFAYAILCILRHDAVLVVPTTSTIVHTSVGRRGGGSYLNDEGSRGRPGPGGLHLDGMRD